MQLAPRLSLGNLLYWKLEIRNWSLGYRLGTGLNSKLEI